MNIYNADCLDQLPKIKPHKPVDLVIVDLPYGQTNCAWDTIVDMKSMWIELKKICKPTCVYIFFCTTKFGYKLIQSNEKDFRYDLVWEKSKNAGFLSANKMPLRKHEMLYVFKAKQGTYNPQKTPGKPYKMNRRDRGTTVYNPIACIPIDNKGDRYPTSILTFNNPVKSIHQTQKPVDLLECLIKTYSNVGETVLDFTMGSGSCGIACLLTNRVFIGIEKDESIFRKAKHRLLNFEIVQRHAKSGLLSLCLKTL